MMTDCLWTNELDYGMCGVPLSLGLARDVDAIEVAHNIYRSYHVMSRHVE